MYTYIHTHTNTHTHTHIYTKLYVVYNILLTSFLASLADRVKGVRCCLFSIHNLTIGVSLHTLIIDYY